MDYGGIMHGLCMDLQEYAYQWASLAYLSFAGLLEPEWVHGRPWYHGEVVWYDGGMTETRVAESPPGSTGSQGSPNPISWANQIDKWITSQRKSKVLRADSDKMWGRLCYNHYFYISVKNRHAKHVWWKMSQTPAKYKTKWQSASLAICTKTV